MARERETKQNLKSNECPRCGGARDSGEKKALKEWCKCDNRKPKFMSNVIQKPRRFTESVLAKALALHDLRYRESEQLFYGDFESRQSL